MLDEVRPEVSEEDAMRAHYVIGERERVLAVCNALDNNDDVRNSLRTEQRI